MTITAVILLMIWTTMLFAMFKFMKANITITYKQEFSDEDRQLLEDLYNNNGDIKDHEQDVQDSIDTVIKTVNDLFLDVTEDNNG